MIKQYFSTDQTTGYIRYWQIVTDDWIRLTPTIWGVFGYALSQGNLSSQFRVDLNWNSLIPTEEFDKLANLLNYVFENENNNEYNYRIIVNSLRMVFDDWWLTYDPISQRPPAPLFKLFYVVKNNDNELGYTESTKLKDSSQIYVKTKDGSDKWHYINNDGYWDYVLDSDGKKTTGSPEYAIDFVAKNTKYIQGGGGNYKPVYEKEKIDQYIKEYYYVVAANDKDEKNVANLIDKKVKFNCFYAFIKGIVLAQYTNKMKQEYNYENKITLNLKSKIFTTLLNDLLIEYGFLTNYTETENNINNEFVNPTTITIYEKDDFLKKCINLTSGFCDEPEPDIFISSPSRDIREPINGK